MYSELYTLYMSKTTTELVEQLRWQIATALERPSNYGRSVTLTADDVLALIAAVDASKAFTITRNGWVMVGRTRLGQVDRYDPKSATRIGNTWRGVKEGGRCEYGFTTRRDAAEWVVAP